MLLKDYFHKEVGLSCEYIDLLESLFETLELPKGYELLKAGSKSKKVFYIEKGLLRVYYYKETKDITHMFFAEKSFFAPVENIFLENNFPYYLETVEPTVLKVVDYVSIESYIDNDLKIQALVRNILTNVIKKLSQRLNSLQFQSAQERYSALLESNPDILLRAPLGDIASYLGITQQTLSVIRAKNME